MSYRFYLILIFSLSSLFTKAQQAIDEIQLQQLDFIIENRGEYIQKKIEKIEYLKKIYRAEVNNERKYNVGYQIIKEYSNFQADSAFKYIDENQILAEIENKQDYILRNKFQYVFVSAQSGLLNEAESVLISLHPELKGMSEELKVEYYRLYQRLYMNLKELSYNTHLEAKYRTLESIYSDSILLYAPENSAYSFLYRTKQEFDKQEYSKAKQYIERYIETLDTLSNDAARGYYYLSEIYKAQGDSVSEVKYLIKSVEADIKSAVKQNRSLRVLAQLLYEQGNVKKSYDYIQMSLNDANFYNTRLRSTQIAEALPIIEKDYQINRNEQEFKLMTGLVLIIVLFIVIFLISIYLYRKREELSKARYELLQSNSRLNEINNKMKQINNELYELTISLNESDQLKEKYIAHFLKLCSTYIQAISEFKKLVNRKIKVGQIQEVHNMTLPNSQMTNDFNNFYREFDKAFLTIFPRFVEEFNLLLREDQRFNLKDSDSLNSELRIFALIRLGIKDSSKIAEFMNYTAVTVYTYRTKVKSKAINKDTFDQDVLNIETNIIKNLANHEYKEM